MTPSRRGRSSARWLATGLVALAALLGTACAPSQLGGREGITAAAPTSTSKAPGPLDRRCEPSHLSLGQVLLGGGAGNDYFAWYLSNVGQETCSLPGGTPTVSLQNTAGAAVVSYVRETPLPGSLPSATRALPTAGWTLDPGARAWFVQDALSPECPPGGLAHDGPFRYEVTLPGGSRLSYSPAYLKTGVLRNYCSSQRVVIGPLEESKPNLP